MTIDIPSSRGRLFVVSGPSGVGKDTVLERAMRHLPCVARSLSATTRPPRPGEIDGKDYCFYTPRQFDAACEAGQFLEWAQYGSYRYGTLRDYLEEQQVMGADVVMKIDVQGARAIKAARPQSVLIFIQPPSLDELRQRLVQRGTDSPERIEERIRIARSEFAAIGHYDYLITNDNLETAVAAFEAIVIAERHRTNRASYAE